MFVAQNYTYAVYGFRSYSDSSQRCHRY